MIEKIKIDTILNTIEQNSKKLHDAVSDVIELKDCFIENDAFQFLINDLCPDDLELIIDKEGHSIALKDYKSDTRPLNNKNIKNHIIKMKKELNFLHVSIKNKLNEKVIFFSFNINAKNLINDSINYFYIDPKTNEKYEKTIAYNGTGKNYGYHEWVYLNTISIIAIEMLQRYYYDIVGRVNDDIF